jgi:hypothetical protein
MRNKIILLSLMLLAFESSIAQVIITSTSYSNDLSEAVVTTSPNPPAMRHEGAGQFITTARSSSITGGALVENLEGAGNYAWLMNNVLDATVDIDNDQYLQFDIKTTIPVKLKVLVRDNAATPKTSTDRFITPPVSENYRTYAFYVQKRLSPNEFDSTAVKSILFENASGLSGASGGGTAAVNTSPLPAGTLFIDNIRIGVAANPIPTVFSAVAVSSTQLNLTWNDRTSGELDYLVEYSTSSASGPFTDLVTLPANTTSYSHTGLTRNTTYYYRIRPRINSGLTPDGATCSGTTLNTPNAPSALSATSISSSQIDLSWADNSDDETGFVIEQSTTMGGPYTEIATTATDATFYSVSTGLSENQTYYFVIKAVNADGGSSYSSEASATTLLTGVKDYSSLSTSNLVYPNPFNDKLMLNAELLKDVERYTVVDDKGKVLKQSKINKTNDSIDLSDLNKGIYLIEFWYNNRSNQTFRIVKL